MSNRTLIIVIAIILLVFGGAVWYARSRQDNQISGTSDSKQQADLAQQQDQQQQPGQPASSAPDQAAVQTVPGCQRDFNPNKLTTDKVNIQNRQVQINVKDFGTITLELYDKDAPKAV